jgi:CHAD domain-containing protein
MAYEFATAEKVRESVRRCGAEELDRAIQELTDGVKVDPVEAVHEARKALKMERSLLRLARPTLVGSVRRRHNVALRDAARRLSGARDADVMLEALEGLAKRYAGQVPAATFTAIRAPLEADRELARSELQASGAIEAAVDELRSVRLQVAGWRLRRGGWAALEGGLKREYGRGRRAWRRAQHDPTVEKLHAFRKRAKDLWYHLRLLEPAAPLTLAGQVKEAHALTKLLGDDHDLAVLRERLTAIEPDVAADLEPVFRMIDHRRLQLQEQAWIAASRAYAEKPRAFARRLQRYWKAGRREARTHPAPAAVA